MSETPVDSPLMEPFKAIYRDVIEGYVGYTMEHRHVEIEFDLFTHANSTLTLNGRVYEITNGTLLLVASRDMHRFVHDLSDAYNRYVVMFSESFISPVLECMGLNHFLDELKSGPRVVQISSALQSHMQSDFSLLATYSARLEKSHDIQLKSMLSTTLIHLLMEMQLEQKRTADIQPMSQRKCHVQKIMNHIDAHYTEELTLDSISEATFLSKYYVSRIFKKATGYSLLEYIHDKRVTQSKILLIETDQGIMSIAMRCGFNNLSNFYRVFRESTGMTPKYYRKQFVRHPSLR